MNRAPYILVWGGDNIQLRDLRAMFEAEGLNVEAEIAKAGFKEQSKIVHSASKIVIVTVYTKG
jgi:hypothetical protein